MEPKYTICYKNGLGVPQNEDLAEFWHQQSIDSIQLTPETSFRQPTGELGYFVNADDLCAAGHFHRENNDDYRAGRCFWQAAMQGHMGATAALGAFFGQGRGGLEKNKDKAYNFTRIAAEGGYTKAMKNLSNCYLHGFGTDKNEVLAQQWLDAYNAVCPASIGPAPSSTCADTSTTPHISEALTTHTPSANSGLGQTSCVFTPSADPVSSERAPLQ